MQEQWLKVKVECDTPLEPVAKYHKGKAGQHVLDSDGYVAEIYIIVTPKKEPEVSDQEYTIPVEVTKDVYERFSGATLRAPQQGENALYLGVLGEVAESKRNFYSTPRMVLTPRFKYPPELRSPRIWGIAIDENGAIGVYREKPGQGDLGWRPTTSWWTEDEVRIFHPSIKLPTLADAGGDWTKAIWQNPDFGKGE